MLRETKIDNNIELKVAITRKIVEKITRKLQIKNNTESTVGK